MLVIIEEVMEMIGCVVFIYSLLIYLGKLSVGI